MLKRTIRCALALLTFALPLSAEPSTQQAAAIPGYRTVATAIVAKPQPTTKPTTQAGYLGIATARNASGRVSVQHGDPNSPAATTGFREDDTILRAGDLYLTTPESLSEYLLAHVAGETVKLTVLRAGNEVELAAVLAPVSRPMKLSPQRAVMGVQFRDGPNGEGAIIQSVQPDLPADKAGIKAGDVIIEMDGAAVGARQAFTDALAGHAPDEEVKLTVKRAGKLEEVHVKLAADRGPRSLMAALERGPGIFKKDVYRLAVVGVEFPDVKHNPRITTGHWEDSFFSRDVYNKTSPTSQPVFGSVNDYYREASAGAFRLEGEMFAWVEVSKKRAEYAPGSGDTQKMLPEALDKLLAREGKDALDGFDGIAFIYAGERVQTNRGGLFWPHRGLVPYNGKRWSYLIVNEGGPKMTNISVFTHEFGHMLGLPDLYARPENPGSEGLGVWCLMSNQISDGRPQHMSAWCKEQLGWLQPTVIDPAVPQKLALAPIEGSSHECFKVLVRADGSEYFLLENRRRTGFDAGLPGEGLLIWRVVAGHPVLEESHGVEGPAGPRSFLKDVPFPSAANHAFTPFTTPSSRSIMGGGAPTFITEIERHPNGTITFAIGYPYF